jgi:hypothetical protein
MPLICGALEPLRPIKPEITAAAALAHSQRKSSVAPKIPR